MKRHSRDQIRAESERHKARTRRKIKAWWLGRKYTDEERDRLLAPKVVGKQESVHTRGCSCTLCGNARRHFGDKTFAENRFEAEALLVEEELREEGREDRDEP
jgi:hypothetical protein